MHSALQRHLTPIAYLAAATMSLPAGLLVARSGQGAAVLVMGLVALGGLAFLVWIPPQTLFLGWLFLAPLFQNAAEHSDLAIGEPLALAIYTVPAVVLTVLTLLGRRRDLRLTALDYVPFMFLGYSLLVIALTSNELQSTPKVIFGTVVLGPVIYYFLRCGPGASIQPERIIAVLMYAASVQGVLAVVNFVTGWNPWGDTSWQEDGHADFPRAVATLSNPGVLGAFVGVGIVCSIAVLSWDSPRALRRPAFITLAACVPGLLTSMTRGPIFATLAAVVLVLVFGRWRFATLTGLVALGLAALAVLPAFQQTDLYEGRVAETRNVLARAALQDWSLKLAAEKPVFGWGYGSFDEAKNTSGFDVEGLNIRSVLQYTSHNTYLTILVERGGLGLLLFALPFVLFSFSALADVRARAPGRWVPVATLAALLIIALSAMTFDLRFFSFAQVLTWILLALLATSRARQIAAAA